MIRISSTGLYMMCLLAWMLVLVPVLCTVFNHLMKNVNKSGVATRTSMSRSENLSRTNFLFDKHCSLPSIIGSHVIDYTLLPSVSLPSMLPPPFPLPPAYVSKESIRRSTNYHHWTPKRGSSTLFTWRGVQRQNERQSATGWKEFN